MLKQLGFVLDTNRCLGCRACVKACQLHNRLPASLVWRQLRELEDQTSEGMRRFFLSTACNHCANPECLRSCPQGAYAKRRDGIVTHNPQRCTGCKSCVVACPFGAPRIHPLTGRASKCQLCHDRIEQGNAPHCVQACISRALQVQEIRDETMNELSRLTAPQPSLRLTRPAVFYYTPRRVKICSPIK